MSKQQVKIEGFPVVCSQEHADELCKDAASMAALDVLRVVDWAEVVKMFGTTARPKRPASKAKG